MTGVAERNMIGVGERSTMLAVGGLRIAVQEGTFFQKMRGTTNHGGIRISNWFNLDISFILEYQPLVGVAIVSGSCSNFYF